MGRDNEQQTERWDHGVVGRDSEQGGRCNCICARVQDASALVVQRCEGAPNSSKQFDWPRLNGLGAGLVVMAGWACMLDVVQHTGYIRSWPVLIFGSLFHASRALPLSRGYIFFVWYAISIYNIFLRE